jgi:hypothetical protein
MAPPPAPFKQVTRPDPERIRRSALKTHNWSHAALKSRTVAPKTRTKFLLKFVRDISTKMTLSFFRASVSVRDLSTSRATNSGIYVLQNSSPEHIPGFECPATFLSAKNLAGSFPQGRRGCCCRKVSTRRLFFSTAIYHRKMAMLTS